MLVREDELRLSDECQRLHVREGPKGYPEVSYEMQKRVAKEFGFDVKIGAELLQCAETLTISKEQRDTVRYISFYRRYNRLREVPILVGQKVPKTVHELPKSWLVGGVKTSYASQYPHPSDMFVVFPVHIVFLVFLCF